MLVVWGQRAWENIWTYNASLLYRTFGIVNQKYQEWVDEYVQWQDLVLSVTKFHSAAKQELISNYSKLETSFL
jgi:hypothetical protein